MNDRIKAMFEDALKGALEKESKPKKEKSEGIDPSEIPEPIRKIIENEIGMNLDDVEITGFGRISKEEFEHCGDCDDFSKGEAPSMEDLENLSANLLKVAFKRVSASKEIDTVEIPLSLVPEIVNTIMVAQVAMTALIEKGVATKEELDQIAAEMQGISL